MLEEEKMYEAALQALGRLAIRDMALSTESYMASEAGDYTRADAADAARAKLEPSILKAEEKLLRAKIGGAKAAKENIAQLIRRDAGNASPQEVEELVEMLTRTFDGDAWHAEQQLARNLEEQARLSAAE